MNIINQFFFLLFVRVMLAYQECLETQDWLAQKDLKVMSSYKHAFVKSHSVMLYMLSYMESTH